MTGRFLGLASAIVLIAAPVAAQEEEFSKQMYCVDFSVAAAVNAQQAIDVSAECADPAKGLHTDMDKHTAECMQLPVEEIDAASLAQRHRALQCSADHTRGVPTTEQACTDFALTAVSNAEHAERINPACLGTEKGLHLDRQAYHDWCMSSTMSDVYEATVKVEDLSSACKPAAAPAGEPVNQQVYCRNYSWDAATAAQGAIDVDAACEDASRGVHTNTNSHYKWCLRNAKDDVDGALEHIKRLSLECASRSSAP